MVAKKLTPASNGVSYVTYKWLLTTIIASATGILMVVGAFANMTFYSKAAGAAVEEKVVASDKRLNDMQEMLKEVRQDIKGIVVVVNSKRR